MINGLNADGARGRRFAFSWPVVAALSVVLYVVSIFPSSMLLKALDPKVPFRLIDAAYAMHGVVYAPVRWFMNHVEWFGSGMDAVGRILGV